MDYRVSVALQTVEPPGERFAARLESGAVVPVDPKSSPAAANPVEMVLVALGGCTAADVISILRKKRQQVTGYEVVVLGDRRAEHPRIFTAIEVVHRVRGRGLSAAAIAEAIRLSDTTYCSVHAMLEATAKITSRFEIVPDPPGDPAPDQG